MKNPRARLGGKEGLSEFQHVSYLAPPSVPVTWQQLYDLQIDMPYKPKLGDEADVSSFEVCVNYLSSYVSIYLWINQSSNMLLLCVFTVCMKLCVVVRIPLLLLREDCTLMFMCSVLY